MNQSDIVVKSAPFSCTVTSYGWDPDLQQDTRLPETHITVWAPVSGATGRAFTFSCQTPEELWNLLRTLEEDFIGHLARTHNYHPPAVVAAAATIPLNLTDLFT